MGDVIHIGPTGPKTTKVSACGIQGRPICRHKSVELSEHDRVAACATCGVELDAFKVLVEYARGEREYHHWAAESQKYKARVDQLLDEEKRAKARIRNAKRKDADSAVAVERAKWVERLERVSGNAREIAELAGKIERAASGETKRHCRYCRGLGVWKTWGKEQACPKGCKPPSDAAEVPE